MRHIPTPEDRAWIIQVATARREQAQKLNCQDRYGLKIEDEEAALKMDIMGCAGEWAFAQEIGEPWQATLDSFTGADHIDRWGQPWQVKTSEKRDSRLIIRRNANPSDFYVLVTGSMDDENGLQVVGYCPARRASAKGDLFDSNGRDPCYMVRRSRLMPVSLYIVDRLEEESEKITV